MLAGPGAHGDREHSPVAPLCGTGQGTGQGTGHGGSGSCSGSEITPGLARMVFSRHCPAGTHSVPESPGGHHQHCRCPLAPPGREGVRQTQRAERGQEFGFCCIYSHLHILVAHLHPPHQAHPPPLHGPGGQRLIPGHQEGSLAECGCPGPCFTPCSRQSSHPGAKSIQLFTAAFL